jgi:hypothetical protein
MSYKLKDFDNPKNTGNVKGVFEAFVECHSE